MNIPKVCVRCGAELKSWVVSESEYCMRCLKVVDRRKYESIIRQRRIDNSKRWRKENPERVKENHRRYNKIHAKELQEWRKQYFRKLKRHFVDMLGGKCIKCNYSKCLCALEFHHIGNKDRKNEYKISPKKFELKIKRGEIELLCNRCHRELHQECY